MEATKANEQMSVGARVARGVTEEERIYWQGKANHYMGGQSQLIPIEEIRTVMVRRIQCGTILGDPAGLLVAFDEPQQYEGHVVNWIALDISGGPLRLREPDKRFIEWIMNSVPRDAQGVEYFVSIGFTFFG